MALTAWPTDAELIIAVLSRATAPLYRRVTGRDAAVVDAAEAIRTVAVYATAAEADVVDRVTILPLSAVIRARAAPVYADPALRVTDEVATALAFTAAFTAAPIVLVAIEAELTGVELSAIYVELTARGTWRLAAEEGSREELPTLGLTLARRGGLNAALLITLGHTAWAVGDTAARLRVTEERSPVIGGLTWAGLSYAAALLTDRLIATIAPIRAALIALTAREATAVRREVTALTLSTGLIVATALLACPLKVALREVAVLVAWAVEVIITSRRSAHARDPVRPGDLSGRDDSTARLCAAASPRRWRARAAGEERCERT